MEFHSLSDVQSHGYSAIARSAFLAKQVLINSRNIINLMGALNSRLELMCKWHKGWITSEAGSKFARQLFPLFWLVTTIQRGYQKDCDGQINARGWAIPAVRFIQELTLNKIRMQAKLGIFLPAGVVNGI